MKPIPAYLRILLLSVHKMGNRKNTRYSFATPQCSARDIMSAAWKPISGARHIQASFRSPYLRAPNCPIILLRLPIRKELLLTRRCHQRTAPQEHNTVDASEDSEKSPQGNNDKAGVSPLVIALIAVGGAALGSGGVIVAAKVAKDKHPR